MRQRSVTAALAAVLSAVMPERNMSRIKAVFKNKYFGYLLDLAVVFIAVAILSSGTGFVLDHRVLVLVLLVVIIVIRGIS